jgi:hypothetical protein
VVPWSGTPAPAPQSKGAPPTGGDVTTGMLNLMRGGATPPAAPAQPSLALPISPQAQKRNAPDLQPKLVEPIDRLQRMELVGALPSARIMAGEVDDHLRNIGYDTLMRNMSYFKNPAQKAAIRSRLKTLKLK